MKNVNLKKHKTRSRRRLKTDSFCDDTCNAGVGKTKWEFSQKKGNMDASKIYGFLLYVRCLAEMVHSHYQIEDELTFSIYYKLQTTNLQEISNDL